MARGTGIAVTRRRRLAVAAPVLLFPVSEYYLILLTTEDGGTRPGRAIYRQARSLVRQALVRLLRVLDEIFEDTGRRCSR